MLAKFIDKICDLTRPEKLEIGGRVYIENGYNLLKNPEPKPLITHSLASIAEYAKDSELADNLIIHIESPVQVSLYSALETNLMQQHTFMVAKYEAPQFNFGQWIELEKFIINLQAQFLYNTDRDRILQVVGNLKDENIRTVGDDGITQQVTAKTGLGSVGNVIVPNPVKLIPFRTFPEVDQPDGDFIFRMKSMGGPVGIVCSLTPADGEDWKLTAIGRIADFFRAEELGLDQNKILILA